MHLWGSIYSFNLLILILIIIIIIIIVVVVVIIIIIIIVIVIIIVWLVPGPGLCMAGGACGLVAGRAGFWGALATWVQGQQPQPPSSWAPNLHVQRKR